jgi:hypothetical protein
LGKWGGKETCENDHTILLFALKKMAAAFSKYTEGIKIYNRIKNLAKA